VISFGADRRWSAGGLGARLRRLARELMKFGSVGAVAFVITISCFNLFTMAAGIGPLTSNGLATVIAATFSFYANRHWTFKGRKTENVGREYVLFFILNAVGLAITQLFVGFTYYVLVLRGAIAGNISLVLGTGVATFFRYYAYKRWVFRKPPARVPSPRRTAAAGDRPHLRRHRQSLMVARTVTIEEFFSWTSDRSVPMTHGRYVGSGGNPDSSALRRS